MRVRIGGAFVLLALAALGWLLIEPDRERATPRRAAPPTETTVKREVRIDEPSAPASLRRYFGSVHGPLGPVWGVGVHAKKAGTDESIGSTATNTRGDFELEIAALQQHHVDRPGSQAKPQTTP